MDNMLSSEQTARKITPKIKVICIGNGGINAVNHMIDCGMRDIEFIAVSSHSLGLEFSKANTQILMGENQPRGLGMLPVPLCRKIAEETRAIFKKHLSGSDIVFVISCMGGSTGSGAASVVASCAREVKARTIAVVTKPFKFEGRKRRKIAETGIQELKENVDALITISGDYIVQFLDKKISITDVFRAADDAIRRCVQSVAEIMTIPGVANIEFESITPFLPHGVNIDNEDNQLMGLPEWMGRPKTDDKHETDEELMPRSDGKRVCAYLRNIRIELAVANNIPFESEPCSFTGSCAGTCEKCDQEAAYLRDEMNKIPEQSRIYPQHILADWEKALCLEK